MRKNHGESHPPPTSGRVPGAASRGKRQSTHPRHKVVPRRRGSSARGGRGRASLSCPAPGRAPWPRLQLQKGGRGQHGAHGGSLRTDGWTRPDDKGDSAKSRERARCEAAARSPGTRAPRPGCPRGGPRAVPFSGPNAFLSGRSDTAWRLLHGPGAGAVARLSSLWHVLGAHQSPRGLKQHPRPVPRPHSGCSHVMGLT